MLVQEHMDETLIEIISMQKVIKIYILKAEHSD